MKKIGILHISDIHINKSSILEIKSLVHKLIEDIEKVKKENSLNINLICFAGDLIDRGDNACQGEMQLQLAEEYFVQPLIQAMGLSENDFILVPGNHEVDKNKIARIIEAGFAAMTSIEDINEIILEMKEEYKSRLEYFYDYMHNKYVPDAEKWNLGYSVIRKINDVNVGIVGIDSAWRSSGAGPEERGRMIVGEQQVEALYSSIHEADLKVCLMHHPLDWLSELEMLNVERKLSRFDLILTGHVHDLGDKQICTQQCKTIYNTSGKLYPVNSYYSGYSILDIDMDLGTCCIYSREYMKSPRENFDKALRVNEEGKVEYQFASYDQERVVEYDLKLQLRNYYEDVSEKFNMLKNINSNIPTKTGDFFVEPVIYEKSEYERTESSRKEEKEETSIPLKDLISCHDNVLLLGKKECGKTTILQRFGISYTNAESDKIPIYIDMLNLGKGKERILNACQNFIFNNVSPEIPIKKQQIENMFLTGKIICLFDNVNISNADHVMWIQTFVNEFPRNRFVFAAEEKFYQIYSLKELPDFGVEYKTVYLHDFGKRHVREMITKWGDGKVGFDANEMTQKFVSYCSNTHFAMTPFNIAVFMTIWDVDKNFIPINEGKVMRTYLETVLEKFSIEEFQRSQYNFDVKQHFLGHLAYSMCQKDKYYFTIEEFERLVDEYHDRKGFKKSQSKFDKIFFEKNILCVHGEQIYFSNISIMEYCLASYALIEPTLYEMMISKGNRSNFVHELAFYSGIVGDCTELLNVLNDEITSTILENMHIVDEVEGLSIDIEFNFDKEKFIENVKNNRYTLEEVDELDDIARVNDGETPMQITKINSIEESESFMDLLLIYGNVIKNAETADKTQKKIHVENYILGMNFQFGLVIRQVSGYLASKTKEDLSEEIKGKHPNLTDEEFEKIKNDSLEFLKIILPMAIQFYIGENIGTPKLEVVINELIYENKYKKFTRFMLSFLLCDIGIGNIKPFLLNYIREEDSKDILKLILAKLSLYYDMWYFGRNPQMDNILLDLLTEVEIKLSGEKNAKTQQMKGLLKKQIKQVYDSKRGKFVE